MYSGGLNNRNTSPYTMVHLNATKMDVGFIPEVLNYIPFVSYSLAMCP